MEGKVRSVELADGQEVLAEKRGKVLLVTLNRPEVRNAVNTAVAHGVASALDKLDANDELRVAIITGAGPGFCAGMDLKDFTLGDLPYVDGRGFAGITRRAADKPVIAAIEGFAVAGGFEIALACDLIVAARDARLGIPEVKRGLVASGGGLVRLPRRIPYHMAMELALTGDNIDGLRAHEIGLVNRVTEPGMALTTGLQLAETIADNAPLAVTASKRMVSRVPDWSEDEAWREQGLIEARLQDTDDAREGAAAFLEKRAPIWKAR